MAYNNYRNTQNIAPIEKLIAILSYFTCGIVGFVWLIIGAVAKQRLKPFMQYHIYQSLFIAFTLFLVSQILKFIIVILGYIPGINFLVGLITYIFMIPINLGFTEFTIVQLALFILTLYLSAGALQGKYSYIPWISDIIKSNVQR